MRQQRQQRRKRGWVSRKSPCCLCCLCCPFSRLNRKIHLSLFSLICVADTALFSFHLSVFSLNNKPRRQSTGLIVLSVCRLLQHAELLTNLNEGFNATVELLSSVACRYLNTDTSLTLWNNWVVETCYEYTLLL